MGSIQRNVHKRHSIRVKPNPFIKFFDILCLEQNIKDKHSDMSEEPSDTDSVNSEMVNSVNYINNSTSYINDKCKSESQIKHTNPMHDSKTSLTDNSYDSSQDNTKS